MDINTTVIDIEKENVQTQTSSTGDSSEIPLEDVGADHSEDNAKVAEEKKKIETSSIKKLVSTLLTIVILIVGGAGAFYGIEGKNEERETGEIVNWKYLNLTLTTIGYGDLTPKTSGGKVFMVFYAIISLGVMAAAITSVGQVIVAKTNEQKDEFMKVSKRFSRKIKKLANVGSIEASEADLKESMKKELAAKKKNTTKKWVLRLIGLLSLIAITILVGAKGFSELESWTYGDAIYYCFVTLLTIGYGDFYPKTDGGKIFFIFYVFIGLGLIAFVVGDVGEKILSNTQARLQEAKLEQTFKNNLANLSKITKLPGNFANIKVPFPKMKGKGDNEKEKEKEKDNENEKENEVNLDKPAVTPQN